MPRVFVVCAMPAVCVVRAMVHMPTLIASMGSMGGVCLHLSGRMIVSRVIRGESVLLMCGGRRLRWRPRRGVLLVIVV
jgi:hypothetical protein